MSEAGNLFNNVRQALYDSFSSCADAIFNTLDSLCGKQQAQSVAELSLELLFDREYSSLYGAIESFFVPSSPDKAVSERQQQSLGRIECLLPALPQPTKYPFWLTGIDATPALRPYADKLADRGITYYPNPAPGNKPIGVGHSYSILALLPERESRDPPWVVPLNCQRIPTENTANEVAASQMTALLSDSNLPFGSELTVNTGDSSYSKVKYLSPVCKFSNHVEILRVARNRKFYRPATSSHTGKSGRPRWFGESFDLKDETTWEPPGEEIEIPWTTKSGRQLIIKLQRWNGLIMHGKKGMPMHDNLFDLVRCQVVDSEGRQVFKHDLWLMVIGERRSEVTTDVAYEAYRQRYDMEHFFRFGKSNMLLDKYQTPELAHEENWWDMVCLAYTQLVLAAPLSNTTPRPWERYLPEWKNHRYPSPSQVQRDYGRIIQAFGTPASPPKPRGNSPGRQEGTLPNRRPARPVIFKNKDPPKKAA
jgi:hypothetical protein